MHPRQERSSAQPSEWRFVNHLALRNILTVPWPTEPVLILVLRARARARARAASCRATAFFASYLFHRVFPLFLRVSLALTPTRDLMSRVPPAEFHFETRDVLDYRTVFVGSAVRPAENHAHPNIALDATRTPSLFASFNRRSYPRSRFVEHDSRTLTRRSDACFD